MNRLLLLPTLILTSVLCEASNWFSSSQFTADAVEVYKTADGQDLELFIFYPDSTVPTEPAPAIILFHGGGYTSGTPGVFFYACEYFTSRGMVAMSARYRLNNKEGARRDGKSAMRYVIEHADRLGVDTDRLAAGGGSAGGNLAVTLANPDNHNEPTDDLSVSAAPDALVLFNPVGGGYNASDMPPTLAQWGDQDTFITPAQALANQQAAIDAGVRMEIEIYPGQIHSWYDNSREWITITMDRADTFLETLGFVAGPPETNAWIARVNNDVGTQPPAVSFTTPADGASFSEWSSLSVEVDASDPDANGAIRDVRLFLDGARLRIDDTAPYAWGPGSGSVDTQLESLAPGSYELEAKAYDNDDYVARATITVHLVDAPTEAPSAPTGLVSIPGDGGPYLDWDPNPEGDVSGYHVYRRDVGGSYGAPILSNVSTDEATDTTAVVGETYFYRISAVDTDGNESQPGTELEVTVESVNAEEVPAIDNSWILAAKNEVQGARESLAVNRGDWASWARSAFIRFPLSGDAELGGLAPEAINRVSLDLFATSTDADDPIRVYALLDGAQRDPAALSETSWTGGSDGSPAGGNNMTNSNRPDTPLYGSAPPNANTTVELGTLHFFSDVDNADVGLHRIDITEIEVFKQLLRDDTNQEITLILRADEGDQITTFASLFNTGGNPVPTLSVFSQATVPAPPALSGLAATPGEGVVALSWTADIVTDPVTYTVYRSETADSAGTAIATGLTSNSHSDVSAVNGTVYYYRVTATNDAGGESDPSNQVLAIPATPGNQPPSFDSIPSSGVEVGAAYSASIAGRASDPESDTLVFSKVSGPDWLTVAPDGSLSGTAPLAAGPNNFMVRVDAAGGSDTAPLEILVVPDDTPPPVPGGLDATAGDGEVSLSWTAASDADTVAYHLYRSETTGGIGSRIASDLTGTSFLDTGVVNGTPYFYVLTAVDAVGNESGYSAEASATPQLALDTTPPAVPTGLSTTQVNGSISLDWTGNTDDDLAHYRVYRGTSSGNYGSPIDTGLNSDYLDTSVAVGTRYYYAVTAVDDSGNASDYSTEASIEVTDSEIVALYTFNAQTLVSSDASGGSDASDITHGGGLGTFPRYQTNTGQGASVPALSWTAFDFNTGVAAPDDYIAFTLTPGAGTRLDYESLGFIHRFNGGNGSDVLVFSSQDNFATAIDTVQLRVRNQPTSFTIDLSGLEPSTEPFEFRLYFVTTATFDVATFIDEITLSASSQSVISADDDADGIDDSWEVQYFDNVGVIDGSVDSDGDGVLDFFEYLYGSAPNDAAAGGFTFMMGSGGSESPNGLTFNWAVQAGRSLGADYEVRLSTDLSQWDPIPESHYTVGETTEAGRTNVQLELTHDYGDKVFLRLIKPE